MAELKTQVGQLTAQLDGLRDAVHRDEMAKAQAAMRIEQLEEQIAEQFAINPGGPDRRVRSRRADAAVGTGTSEYEDAKARGELVVAPAPMPYDWPLRERRAKQAQRDLNTLGKVNPLALEEFAALEERYSFPRPSWRM